MNLWAKDFADAIGLIIVFAMLFVVLDMMEPQRCPPHADSEIASP